MKLAENAMGSLFIIFHIAKQRATCSDQSVRPSKITCPKHIFSPVGLSVSYFTHIVIFSKGFTVT